jgi:hypothetical protein
MGLEVPLTDSTRAIDELGWAPRHSAGDALLELLDGIRRSSGMNTPPLEPKAGGQMRIRECLQAALAPPTDARRSTQAVATAPARSDTVISVAA